MRIVACLFPARGLWPKDASPGSHLPYDPQNSDTVMTVFEANFQTRIPNA